MHMLSPRSFQADYVENNIQQWVDAHPHFVNAGRPMLSLGTEIATRHGGSIDNLFIDGNGHLVVAEMKRGRTPREVMAQIMDYAAHASRLEWPDLESICEKRHGTDLGSAFRQCFGRRLLKAEKIEHRLLVLAESYDPSVMDVAIYLINNGTPLTLLEFTYFVLGDSKLFEVRSVLGEIPDQPAGPADGEVPEAAPDEGYGTWLFESVATELRDIAKRQGWDLQFKVNKQSLPFAPVTWPTALGHCQFRLDIYKKGILQFVLAARKDEMPGFKDFIDQRRDQWRHAFPAEFDNPPYTIVNAALVYARPAPEVGDAAALADIVRQVESMTGAMVPLVNEYFEHVSGGEKVCQ